MVIAQQALLAQRKNQDNLLRPKKITHAEGEEGKKRVSCT